MIRGKTFIVSGPSGVGKSTVLKALIEKRRNLYFSISATTRDARPGERDGVHYHFISVDEFRDWISRDEAVVDAYMADPLCQFIPTVGMYRDMLGGLQYISSRRALSRMDPDTPVYLYAGDKDPVGSNGAGVKKVYGYFQAAGTKDLSIKLYENGRHEMHNETNKDEVFSDVLSWLEKHL